MHLGGCYITIRWILNALWATKAHCTNCGNWLSLSEIREAMMMCNRCVQVLAYYGLYDDDEDLFDDLPEED